MLDLRDLSPLEESYSADQAARTRSTASNETKVGPGGTGPGANRMKRLIISACSLAALCFFVLGAGKSKENDEFSGLITKLYQAWSSLDANKAADFYAKDDDLTFFDLAPLKYDHGWKEYSSNFNANVAPTFSSITLTANPDLKVIHKGKITLTTLTFHAAAKLKDGNAMDLDGRHTLVWEKRGGRWLIIHEHVSKPL